MPPWKKTFYAAWIGQVCSITGFFVVMPLLPLYIKELSKQSGGMTDAEIKMWSGIVTAASAFTMAIAQPIWGALADRFGRKPMVLRSMLCGSVVLVMMGYARSATDVMFLRMLQGAVTGTVTATVALVSSATPRRHSGRALGMMSAAVFCGGAVGPLIGGLMAEYVGFYATFAVAACIVLLGAFLVQRFVQEDFTPRARTDESRLASTREIFAAAGFIAALLVLFQMRFANSIFRPVFALFVEELHGQEAGARAWTGCIRGLGGFAAAISAGVVFNRLVESWGHKKVLVVSTLAAGLLTIPVALSSSVWQLLFFHVLFGFAVAATTPCANVIIGRIIHQQHLGKAYGITASVTCLGWGTGPLIGGWMGGVWGTRSPFFLGAAVLILTGLTVALFLRVPAQPAPEQ